MRLLTLARDLSRRKARERRGLFIAEGVRAAEELVRSPLRVRGALTSPAFGRTPREARLLDALRERQVAVEQVPEPDFAGATDTESPQGVLVIGEAPERSLDALVLPPHARLLVLDGVQDPGNVGTLVRTAAALGAAATLALPGTADLWNAKVVRGAMGALFRHPALSITWDEVDAFRARHGVELWGADMDGDPVERVRDGPVPPRVGLVVGNEGAGLSDAARARLARRVVIPIAEGVESLNVAVAAGILLHELRA